MSEPAWLTKARSYIGFHEIPNNHGISEFINLAHTGSDGDPWCAIFANACLEAVGIKGTRSPAAASFTESPDFVRQQTPQLGTICTFTRVGGNHVAFYTGTDSEGRLLVLGGNQSNQVCIEPHSTDTLTGYWWPKNDMTSEASDGWSQGKGSWYSQFKGNFTWVDDGDAPNSNALGVPDDAQGISFYNHGTLGQWFEVIYPNNKSSIEIQSDIGPNPKTGRLIDISAAAAERAGYTPRSFPTDSIIKWRPVTAPIAVVGLSPKLAATRYRDLRKGITMADQTTALPTGTTATPPPQLDLQSFMSLLEKGDDTARKVLTIGVVTFNALHPTAPLKFDSPAATPAPAPPAATPVTQRASVQLGTLGTLISGILQATGIIGTTAGLGSPETVTTAGTLSTLIPAATAIFGAVGGWGTVAKVLGKIIAIVPK